jgi:hypothetical protein
VSEQESGALSSGISRRAALKRGVLAGGALVWTVPVIQAVSMTPAHAESASAPPSTSGGSGQVGAAAPPPAGALSYTGPSVPVVGTAVVGAGLVATGVTATVVAGKLGAAKAAQAATAATETAID